MINHTILKDQQKKIEYAEIINGTTQLQMMFFNMCRGMKASTMERILKDAKVIKFY